MISDADYERFHTFAWDIYNTYMKDNKLDPPTVSIILKEKLFRYLEQLNIIEINGFANEIDQILCKLLKVNEIAKQELLSKLPEQYSKNLTDYNSVIMGIPNNIDSDLDFTIGIKTTEEQQTIGRILESIGYKLANIYEDNIPSDIKWHDYIKHNDEGIEIEVKVRWQLIVNRILIAHRGIMYNLTPEQKLKVSFIKSVLTRGDKKTYKTFKYILYGAMFNGNDNTIIFRHD
jgi:hypothetical protein